MAKLTNLSKGLIAMALLCGMGSSAFFVVTNFIIDDGSSTDDDGPGADAGSDSTDPEPKGLLGGLFDKTPDGPLGTPGNPIKMSIVSFTGYAPALLANGGSLTTKAGSIFAESGIDVEFVLQDNIPTLAENFGSGTTHCAWRTIDFWAQEHPGLQASGYDARMVAIVDNTRGADAIVARQGINSVEDLAGKKVGLLQFTPSHWMLDYAIENSSMTKREKKALRESLIFSQGDLAEIRAMLKSGQIDAAVLWDPDTSLAQRDIEGSQVVFSTQVASNLVFDGIVCDSRVIDEHPAAVAGLVAGWMAGVEKANANKQLATDALIATEPYFEELNKSEGPDFINSLYPGIKWTGLADNVRILGLGDGGGDATRVYTEAGKVWRANGGIADLSKPPIAASLAFDTRFIEKLAEKNVAARAAAAVPEFDFTPEQRIQASQAPPVLTKPVSIYFDSGSSKLDVNAKTILDDQVVPLIEAVGSAYISVEGNTDKTGSRNGNLALSGKRAQAVTDYLVDEWEFDTDRFAVVGNGPDKPVCDEDTPDCFERNRRTDIAVYSR
jgi:outer membrane protein OmpA-like peptidoglycan-associated protein/ABC-type nitrate/sulfonate/bicarbonate transport system substrate-binding protein